MEKKPSKPPTGWDSGRWQKLIDGWRSTRLILNTSYTITRKKGDKKMSKKSKDDPNPASATENEKVAVETEADAVEFDPKFPLWIQDADKDFKGINNPVVEILPPGMYYHVISDGEVYYRPVEDISDNLINLPGLPIQMLLEQIANFWSKTEQYHKYGFMQKRGIILYGPPGCGKTSIISILKEQLIREQDGVIFTNANGFHDLIRGIEDFRKREPERPIMTIVEDLETQLESSNGSNTGSSEKAALSLYDGEHQFDRIVHIATTNKPDLLADRFIKRPGRFDLVIGIHPPTRETREAYLRAICKNALTLEQEADILDATEGLSLAYMREIAMTYLVLGIPLKETISRIKEHSTAKYESKRGKTGFTIGFTDTK